MNLQIEVDTLTADVNSSSVVGNILVTPEKHLKKQC